VSEKGEYSAGGSAILRHAPADDGFVPPEHVDSEWLEAIEGHLTRLVAPAQTVLHEIVSHRVHVDVHVVPPTAERPYHFLFTTGMSTLPMNRPADAPGSAYAELAVLLPPDWRLGTSGATTIDAEERWYWPIRWLKFLARFPHEYRTWLHATHTIPNGDPPAPFDASTKLCGMLLLPSLTLPRETCTIPVPGGKTVDLWTLYPLHADEMDYKLRVGMDGLIDRFAEAGVSDILDPDRPSCLRKPPRKK